MTVYIQLTTAGANTGPFNLYSDVDGYTTAFESGVAKSALVAGYTSALVPNGTTTIRVQSVGACTNYIDIVIGATTTTTTTIVGTRCIELELYNTTNELACPSPPSQLFDVFRTYRATLLDGPGGTPVAAATSIVVTVPTSGDFGTSNLTIIIGAGNTYGEDSLYTRVYPDCNDRSQVLIQTVNLGGATTSQFSFCAF